MAFLHACYMQITREIRLRKTLHSFYALDPSYVFTFTYGQLWTCNALKVSAIVGIHCTPLGAEGRHLDYNQHSPYK